MHNQPMRSETPVVTAIVHRALALGFDLGIADEEALVIARSHHLPEILEAIGRTRFARLIVLEPRPSRRRIGSLVLTHAGESSNELLVDIQCHGAAAHAVLEEIAQAREQSH